MSPVADSSSLEFDELQRILAGYLEAVEGGRAVAVEDLCAEHPTFAEEIREFVESEQEVIRLAGPTVGERAQLLASSETSRIIAARADTRTFPLATRSDKRRRREIPERFGRYRILRELGAGAMGTVFLALDEKLERQVALKIPHDQFDGDSELARRFDREAKTAAGLHHRNVCPVHDVGEFEGLHYLAMSFIDGLPLDERFPVQQPPEPTTAARLIAKLACALQEAHDKGIVHRDLKPANVMIDTEDEPVIMDFGLALQTDRQDQVRVTQRGTIIGTPAYMAPEQIDGDLDSIGPASDIYSLGVIFYELLTGRLPFRGGLSAVVNQILSKPPAKPSELREGIDPALERICLRMLSKNTADRFGSMAEVAAALEQALAAEDPSSGADWAELVAERESHRRRSRIWLLVAIGTMLLLPLGIWLSVVTFRTGYGTVEVEIPAGVEGIELRLVKSGQVVQVLDPTAGWSFRVEQGRYEIDLQGDTDQFHLEQDTVTVPRDEAVRVQVTLRPSPLPSVAEFRPEGQIGSIPGPTYALSLSPDRKILIAGGKTDQEDGYLVRIDLATEKQLRRDYPGVLVGEGIGWLDADHFAIGKSDGTVDVVDCDTLEVTETIRVASTGFVKPCFSPNRKLMASASADGIVSLHTLNTQHPQLVAQEPVFRCRALAFAAGPADEQLLYVGGYGEVLVWNLDTGSLQTLCKTSGQVREIHVLHLAGQLMFVTANGRVECVDLRTGQGVREFVGHAAGVESLDVSGDERYAITGSTDDTVRVWSVATGEELFRGRGPRAMTNRVVADWGGQSLYSGGGNYFSGSGQRQVADDLSIRRWQLSVQARSESFVGPIPYDEIIERLCYGHWREARAALEHNLSLNDNRFLEGLLAMTMLAMNDREGLRQQTRRIVEILQNHGDPSPIIQGHLVLPCALGGFDAEHTETLLFHARTAYSSQQQRWETVHPLVVMLYRTGRFDEAVRVNEAAMQYRESPWWQCLNHLWHALILHAECDGKGTMFHYQQAKGLYPRLMPAKGDAVHHQNATLRIELELIWQEALETLEVQE